VKVIAETYPLTEVNRAYDRVAEGKVRFRAVLVSWPGSTAPLSRRWAVGAHLQFPAGHPFMALMWSGLEGGGSVARARMRGLVLALAVGVAINGCGGPVRRRRPPPQPAAEATIADRIAQYGPGVRTRLAPYFRFARVPYPPTRFVLLGLKQERELQLFAAGPGQELAFVRTYPIYGASGVLGPKLREGDRQVPEGIYTIAYLNPNSISHLSLALSYPNDYDRARRKTVGTTLRWAAAS
jgi:hypothetical protein